ncbi:hypothetical protein [Luteimonas terrae]|uniref:Uncharacterized protein n=1 Tax=Luteimonas terrae TaxID=1530191 RepID=A0ABU1Y146_9GAMM|nr:hypothetical protein [Luteimonas terrae]MDR7194748.1 hypothetical protein [Luteimonas terrae]
MAGMLRPAPRAEQHDALGGDPGHQQGAQRVGLEAGKIAGAKVIGRRAAFHLFGPHGFRFRALEQGGDRIETPGALRPPRRSGKTQHKQCRGEGSEPHR